MPAICKKLNIVYFPEYGSFCYVYISYGITVSPMICLACQSIDENYVSFQ